MKQHELISSIPDYIDSDLWSDFIQHRKEIRHKLTPTAQKFILKKLARFHLDGVDVNLAIVQTIENGWQGIFAYYETKANGSAIPKSDEAAIRWGAERGIEAKVGESMWDFRSRLEARA